MYLQKNTSYRGTDDVYMTFRRFGEVCSREPLTLLPANKIA